MTLDEMVTNLVEILDDSSKQIIKASTEEELSLFNRALGADIQLLYGVTGSEATLEVIRALWARLNKPRLRAKLPRF